MHGVEGVAHQVADRLREVGIDALEQRQLVGQLDCFLDFVLEGCVAIHEVELAVDQQVEINLFGGLALPALGEDILDHFAHAVAGSDNFVYTLDIRVHLLYQLAEAHDRHQRVAQVVDDACGQDPDRGHAFGLDHLGRELPRLLDQPHVVDGHRRLRGQRLDEDFLLAGEGDHHPLVAGGVEQLQHGDDAVFVVFHRQYQHRLGAVAGQLVVGFGAFEMVLGVEIDVFDIEYLTGGGGKAGPAFFVERHRGDVHAPVPARVAAAEGVVVGDFEGQDLALDQVEGPGIGAGKRPGFGENELQKGVEIVLGR